MFARKCNPKNVKSIYKGAECCFELKLYDDAVKWCEMGLKTNENDAKLIEIKTKSLIAKVALVSFKWRIARNSTVEKNQKSQIDL